MYIYGKYIPSNRRRHMDSGYICAMFFLLSRPQSWYWPTSKTYRMPCPSRRRRRSSVVGRSENGGPPKSRRKMMGMTYVDLWKKFLHLYDTYETLVNHGVFTINDRYINW